MKCSRPKTVFTALYVTLALVILPSFSSAQNATVPHLGDFLLPGEGLVEISSHHGPWKRVTRKIPLYEGMIIRTGKKSSALITRNGETDITLGSRTTAVTENMAHPRSPQAEQTGTNPPITVASSQIQGTPDKKWDTIALRSGTLLFLSVKDGKHCPAVSTDSTYGGLRNQDNHSQIFFCVAKDVQSEVWSIVKGTVRIIGKQAHSGTLSLTSEQYLSIEPGATFQDTSIVSPPPHNQNAGTCSQWFKRILSARTFAHHLLKGTVSAADRTNLSDSLSRLKETAFDALKEERTTQSSTKESRALLSMLSSMNQYIQTLFEVTQTLAPKPDEILSQRPENTRETFAENSNNPQAQANIIPLLTEDEELNRLKLIHSRVQELRNEFTTELLRTPGEWDSFKMSRIDTQLKLCSRKTEVILESASPSAQRMGNTIIRIIEAIRKKITKIQKTGTP